MLLLHEACQVCDRHADSATDLPLFKCARCHAALYCGRECQNTDFAAHKTSCRRVKKLRVALANEERALRNANKDASKTANAFATDVGDFWDLPSTRPYMGAKLELIRALSTIPSRTAIEDALAEANDSLLPCRMDSQGVREVVPTLLLLLGRVQDAYDLLKWETTDGSDPNFNWMDRSVPFRNVRDADMSEPLPPFHQRELPEHVPDAPSAGLKWFLRFP